MPEQSAPLLRHIESVVLFVPSIETAARWYAELFSSSVEYENAQFAFVRAGGTVIGFHPADAKCPGGVGGTTVYWAVSSLVAAIDHLVTKGACVHRGPHGTSSGASIALLIDPFGNTIGLNEPREE